MIILPSVADVLRGVVHDIQTNLKPGIEDPVQQAQLDTIIGVLTGCAIRSKYEGAWIEEEISAISKVSGRYSDADLTSPALNKAMSELETASDPKARYQAASEMLSSLSEIEANADLSKQVWGLMEQRLENETRIIGGGFEAAGRG